MTIPDNTIERLKFEAAEVEKAEFAHGLKEAASWAEDSHLPDIRSIYKACLDREITHGREVLPSGFVTPWGSTTDSWRRRCWALTQTIE
jgi:hypothetical protein